MPPNDMAMLVNEMEKRAGPPPKDEYLARLFTALVMLAHISGDKRSTGEIIDALRRLYDSGQLFPDDGR